MLTADNVDEIMDIASIRKDIACTEIENIPLDDPDIYDHTFLKYHDYACYMDAISDLRPLMSAEDAYRLTEKIIRDVQAVADAHYDRVKESTRREVGEDG